MLDAALLFNPLQCRCREIAPAKLREEPIPDYHVAFVQPSAFFKTPLQDLFVGSARQDALAKIRVAHTQKVDAGAIGSFSVAQIDVIIFTELTARVQTNLVQHTREIYHSA